MHNYNFKTSLLKAVGLMVIFGLTRFFPIMPILQLLCGGLLYLVLVYTNEKLLEMEQFDE
jgi:hypothetical protein